MNSAPFLTPSAPLPPDTKNGTPASAGRASTLIAGQCETQADLGRGSATRNTQHATRPAIFGTQTDLGPGSASANIQAIAGVVIKELYRRKDFYVLFILTALITLALGSARFFGEDGSVRYLKEICLLLIWIAGLVIAITTTARQIPAERENRTIFPLLAKPVTRQHLVLGKFFGCWMACGLALLVFYLFFGVISAAREHDWTLGAYFQILTLHWFLLGIIVAMTLLGSIVFAAPSSNSTITLLVAVGILLLGRHLNTLALQLAAPAQQIVYAIYFAIPHLELFDVRDLVIHNQGTIPWLIWCGALGYAAAYSAAFLGTACLIFRRKALN